MPYTQQVLAVLVRDRQRAIALDRANTSLLPLRRRAAGAVYALAKAVTIFAVILDDEQGEPVRATY